jgi:hypothetical protein
MDFSLDTAKAQRIALDKALDFADITPQTLAKVFKDVGESPEKLRALLNLWFTPWFKPSFVPDRDYAGSGPRDVEFLGTVDSPPGQLPYRMFDIETGNLVDFPAIGVRGQYCMLSHRWKGVELTLGYIKEARKKELERTMEAVRNGAAVRGGGQKSDVQLVLEQCRLDLEEQEKLITELCEKSGVEEGTGHANVADLLDRRLKARAAEDGLGWARDKEHQTRSKVQFAQMEQRMFSKLVNQMHDQVDEKMEEYLGQQAGSSNTPSSNDVGSEVVKEAQEELKRAEDSLRDAENALASVQDDIGYFRRHGHLRDALDELVCRLQRWKSAIKLERAIQQADHIFKTKLFQRREKCYLWTDTCCIDKTNGGELSESLSLMGDWYAEAEYTLVQIDTPFREADAVADWPRFDAERRGEDPSSSREPNIREFGDIKGYDPEWSTRAWTLQELVMSKTTFYVNSEWAALSRPVESLGRFYHLMPFIALYTRSNTRNIYRSSVSPARGLWDASVLKEILADQFALNELDQHRENIKGKQSGSSKGALENAISRVETAQGLIAILHALGVQISGNLTTETATSAVAASVCFAAADLVRGGGESDRNSSKRDLFVRLRERLPHPDLASLPRDIRPEDREEEIAQHAINFLLQCLVQETEELILADRQYVADFGQVQQLKTWQLGTSRTGFSAQSVLEVSGKRRATVATDRSYALMGVLGVRFPTFPAEGYAKALARLLDEVVTTRNDISVFNWTGMDMGSPIRGRSMYPSSHTAYGSQEDRGRRYNLLLSTQVQDKMNDVVDTYHGVIQTLRHAIDFLKDRERKKLPFNWVERIVQLVQQHTFQELKHQQEAFGKIVWYARELCRKEKEKLAEKAAMAESAASPTDTGKTFSLLKRPTMASVQSMPSLSTSFSLSAVKGSSTAKDGDSTDTTKKGAKFSGLSKGIKAPSFSLSKKSTSSAASKEPVVTEAEATQSPQSTEVTPDPPPPYEQTESLPTQLAWHAVDKEVMDYLTSPTAQRTTRSLPPDLESIKLEHHKVSQTCTHSSPKDPFEGQGLETISPNPIIVNNAGIEGLFDIQRVIVTMVDPDKLRRQIARAISPHTKISGWCSISTGFARVVTGFACERHILEQELDVIESVEARVLREQDKDKSEKRSAQLLKNVSISTTGSSKPVAAQPVDAQNGEEQSARAAAQEPSQSRPPSSNTDSDNTDEERLVSRMIDFIQEPHLELIAGEWVLARFSGCPGANWFLCHLELGPVPGQFYGHRIAAGAIDFHGSTPEPGLVNAWQTYMDRKKRKMCYILNDYLRSRMSSMDGEEKLKAGADLLRGLRSPGAEKASMEGSAGAEEAGQKEQGEDSGDESDESTLLDQVLRQGKLAAKTLGQYTVLAAAEKLFEMRADHLDKTLATAVLKRTPKSLRSAVENMNDNKSFLPAMFHSSTRVHMF